MTGLTLYSNNHIVEDVYRNYKLKNLIIRMIDYSLKDQSYNDLEMYIYEQLLKMDNMKLNSMYQNGKNTSNPNVKSTKLRNFISQIIRYARNGGVNGNNTEYANYLRIKNTNETFWEHYDIEDTTTYDKSIDYIVIYIDQKCEMLDDSTYTSDELRTILAFTILKKYYLSDLTQIKLAKHLGLSRSTINTLMRSAKADIKLYWKSVGQFLD